MPTPMQIEEGARAVERALAENLPAEIVAERAWDAMRLAPKGRRGRPIERADDQQRAMEELQAGASMRSVQRKYKFGTETVMRLKRRLTGVIG